MWKHSIDTAANGSALQGTQWVLQEATGVSQPTANCGNGRSQVVWGMVEHIAAYGAQHTVWTVWG
jgi:hypothetical protein